MLYYFFGGTAGAVSLVPRLLHTIIYLTIYAHALLLVPLDTSSAALSKPPSGHTPALAGCSDMVKVA